MRRVADALTRCSILGAGKTRAADLLGKAFLVHHRVSPLEAVLAGILPLIGITGDIAFDGAEAVVGPVIIATMLLPYLVPPPLVRQIRAEGERARGF